MGKTSDKFITDINGKLQEIQTALEEFKKVKPVFIKLTDDNIELITERVDILNGKYKGSEKQALLDPEYVDLGKKADAVEVDGQRLENQLDQCMAKMEKGKADALFLLTNFESYVTKKEKETKMPWNKKSVGSSKAFITRTRDALKAFTVPRKGF